MKNSVRLIAIAMLVASCTAGSVGKDNQHVELEADSGVATTPGDIDTAPGAGGPIVVELVPTNEPECPAYPPEVTPIDPGIASGAECRGACGADCPDTCRSIPAQEQCLEWQSADGTWHSKTCRWDGLIECGSHAGCRAHDTCYDGCANARFPGVCRRGCDATCVADHGAINCYRWWGGDGPYDSWIAYGPGVATVDGPYDTTCY